MNQEIIEDHEILYRAVLDRVPDALIEGQISPSVFMDPNGASFDRDGERDENEILDTLRSRFKNHGFLNAAKISCKQCRDAGTFPIPKPSRRNVYHAEVHDSEEVVEISLYKAMQIAACAQLLMG